VNRHYGELKTKSYLREVLLSYRLILGSETKSRRLFRNSERYLASRDGIYDPLLDAFCGRKFLPINSEYHGISHFHSSYSASHDFPYLGQRLLELQRFSLGQKPSRLMELWQDRRNPPQWLTFWAVLILGGISIVFSILQTGLSLAQLLVSLE